MIVLDTNVVSEVMRPRPSQAVMAWFNDQIIGTVYLSSITVTEQLFGIRVLPAGRRRDTLEGSFAGIMRLFEGRILPFDTQAARYHADMAARARSLGLGFPVPDSYIAAIAMSHGFSVASRDVSAFEAGGVRVIDPWDDEAGSQRV